MSNDKQVQSKTRNKRLSQQTDLLTSLPATSISESHKITKRREEDQKGIEPFSLRSRLLAPTESEYHPEGRIHDWLTTSQIDRS